MHAAVYGGCGGPAFLMPRIPCQGSVILRHEFLSLDGQPLALLRDRVRCCSCGGSLAEMPVSTRFIVPYSALRARALAARQAAT